ncbi:unnamed protein product [Cylindrotheca closterium]|uniref:Uncharacterized protein n=1 Tax=Cylindrotheca closterium TaxID=2856 RepID=A0AAD2FNY1_9STRA|nr:unnamed protein product [Cylindrotheca closterium]
MNSKVAANNNNGFVSKSKSESTMESSSSPLQILSASSSMFDYLKGMMECGTMDGDAGDAFEVTYDGKEETIVHSQRHERPETSKKNKKKRRSSKTKRSPQNRKEVSKTHEYIHVDEMTDDEIAESWYTNEDIKKFRKQKKEERRMRKRLIQMERLQRNEGTDEFSDGESSTYTSESDSDSYKKAVSWGNSFQNDSVGAGSESEVSDQEGETTTESRGVVKPVLKKSQSDDKTLLANGMAYRREKTAQRTTMEQRRLAAMHKAFYRSGILFRADPNRMERFFHLSNQYDESDEITFFEEEGDKEKERQEQKDIVNAPVAVRQDLIDTEKDESKVKVIADPSPTPEEPEEPEVVVLKEYESTSEIRKDITVQKDYSNDEEEKSELHYPSPEARQEVYGTPFTSDANKSTSPIANMELILSLQPNQNQHRKQPKYKQKAPFATPDSFSFPSYPALYDNPSNNDDYFEYRMEEVLEEHQRSSELPELSKKYQTFRKKLLGVVKSVKTYQKAISQMEQARSACLDECSNLIQEPSTGKVRPGTFQFAVEKSPITKLKELAEMEQENRAKEFQECVLDYATRWEDSVTQRVDKELKQVKKLQQSRSHYEKKVDSLRKKCTALDTKGKDIPADLLVKLERNEIKLKDALEVHEWNASRLCALIEQVTQYGWKDLLPLVSNLMKYEFNRSGGELAMYGKFPLVMESFQQPFLQIEEEGKISDLD